MDSRAREITRHIKHLNPNFYCKRDGESLRIWEKRYRHRPFMLDDNSTLFALVPDDYIVCSLTDNWGFSGKPRDWGILPIINHLQKIDWRRYEKLKAECLKEEEKAAESKERDKERKFMDLADETYYYAKKDWAYERVALNKEADKRQKTIHEMNKKFKE